MDAARLSCDARRTSNRDNRSGQLIHFHPFPFAGKKKRNEQVQTLVGGGFTFFLLLLNFPTFITKRKEKERILEAVDSLCASTDRMS